MKFFKGKKDKEQDNVIQMNENGEIIDNKKKSKAGKIAKRVAVGVGCAAVGIITFVAVGAAVAYSQGVDLDGTSSESVNDSNELIPDSTEPCEDSPEESTVSTEE